MDKPINQLLASLDVPDWERLEPHLEAIDLPLRFQLEARNRPIKHVYFIESGIASVVADGEKEIEVGLIGWEGMSGLPIVLGSAEPVLNQTYMQFPGAGHRVTADVLRNAMTASPRLHAVFLRYAHFFLVQTTQTALSNGRYKIEERLARWLLMAADRIEGDELSITHEFMAIMLGVRRSGVTVAIQELQHAGFIGTRRGIISINDRKGLEAICGSTYEPLKR